MALSEAQNALFESWTAPRRNFRIQLGPLAHEWNLKLPYAIPLWVPRK